jgi:NAD(P)H dehydrogenase (quinone)
MTIAIAGSSGNFGRAAANHLLDLVEPSSLVLVSRTPDKLAGYAGRGVTVRFGDFDQPESLAGAFAGVDRLLLISATDIGRRVPQHVAAIEAAGAAGVGRIAYTSFVNPGETNPAIVSGEHRATEEALRTSGLAWTMLRNAEYAELQVDTLKGATPVGAFVHNRGAGGSAFIARDDAAAVAATVLATDGHEGRIYDVTGPELLTGADLAALATDLSGISVDAVAVDDAAFIEVLVGQAGLSEPAAAAVATFGQAVREGHLERQTMVVEDITGRPAIRVRDLLAGSLVVPVS